LATSPESSAWRTALIVEPSQFNRMGLRHLCRRVGCERILEEEDAAGALATLSAELVDLVLVAWELPDQGGATLVRRLRARNRQHPPVVVVVDDQMDKPALVSAIKAGAAGRLARPWDPEHLEHILREAAPPERRADATE